MPRSRRHSLRPRRRSRPGGSVPVAERAAIVRRAAELHRERRKELAAIIVREMGKPFGAAVGEVDFSADITEYYADQADVITADQPLTILGEGTAVIRRSPLGVLFGIMPWNFPYYQVARFAAPNLVLGNVIVLKHASQCPESAAAIEAIYRDAGLPEGAYVNVYVSAEQAATIVADPRIQGVSVTGSERAGAAVAEVAGRHLKKVALELGGSDPFIVLATDDLDAVVEAATTARLDNTGQSCNAAKRFIVVDGLYDEFLAKFTAAMAASPMGDPMARGTVLGPLSSVEAATRLQGQVDRAVAQGATVVTGGGSRDGAYYPATVLTGVTPDDGCLSGGVLRTGRRRLPRGRRGRRGHAGQRHQLRAGFVRVQQRSGAGGPGRRSDRGGHGLRQHRGGRQSRAAVRRRQAQRHGPRAGSAGGR